MKNAQILQCVICQEAITNPICPECLAKEIKTWLREKKPIWINSVTEPKDFGYGSKCIFCGRGMSICAHCYSYDFYEYLLETDPELAEEFVEYFNYDIRVPS